MTNNNWNICGNNFKTAQITQFSLTSSFNSSIAKRKNYWPVIKNKKKLLIKNN